MMNPNIFKHTAQVGLFALAATGSLVAQDKKAEEAPKEEPAQEKAEAVDPAMTKKLYSFGFGYNTGRRFAQEISGYGLELSDLDMEEFIKSFQAGVKEEDPYFEDVQIQTAMTELGNVVQKREADKAKANLEEGKKFLEENAKREGVVTLDSGLQYEIIEKGGEETYSEPKEGEAQKQFLVNYKGTLVDGTVFDQSPEGSPVPMTLQVIDGFKEALTKMPVGAKWKLFIPSELAYKDQRRSPQIGPNSTLIFELELVGIEDAPAQSAGFPIEIPQGE